MIQGSEKNVSSVTKSKIDWDKYTKEQKLEKELQANRKDGYLVKKSFLSKVDEREHAYNKEIERVYEKNKLKSKPT